LSSIQNAVAIAASVIQCFCCNLSKWRIDPFGLSCFPRTAGEIPGRLCYNIKVDIGEESQLSANEGDDLLIESIADMSLPMIAKCIPAMMLNIDAGCFVAV
jgi:hypothetical protein